MDPLDSRLRSRRKYAYVKAYAMRKQASVAPSTSGGTNDLQTDPGASKKSKNKKSTTPDLHASSNGWSPATDEVSYVRGGHDGAEGERGC